MARSPRRISAHRRSRSRSREMTRIKTQLNGKGAAASPPPDGDWMTVSARGDSSPPPPAPLAEPLVQSVRQYLAQEPAAKPPPAPPAAPPAAAPTDADIAAHTARDDIRGINFEARLKRHDLNNNPPRPPAPAPAAPAAPAMPSQAELLQRQPLLAARKAEPPAGTDESDPDPEGSPRHPDFVLELGGAARDERYPKEVLKTLVSFVFLFGCVCVNMASLSLVHERLPDRNSTPPLGDIVLDNVAARDWGLAASEYLIMVSSTTAALVVVFHKHRFIVARRLFLIVGLLYLYRSVTMFVTVLPVSSATYYCSPQSAHPTPLLILRHTFYLISGFGLSINGKHTYCGDYIYSGHSMVLVLSYLVVAEYSPRRLWPLHWALAAAAAAGVALVLLAHGHYTVDVVVAYYVTTRLFWSVHALLAARAAGRGGARGGAQWLAREWWFFLFSYLERNVRGPVPRRYDWPLPWPRGKLFSRLS
ncbi:phosphatidylcholine:ceramide cholinephosphotransferase 1 isoform X1 [Plutella xylostella]|uniref:phosphatidylcholine:ceramide cholinephosphotransferase 1 isoform X1 n=2 Tax=Plutella xylostella TaxID=51655 RepID=UPI002032A83B|nr:phosphatidylcholine:ceramide cholinephosphotransferase 1 isoform X1 [Plutella xylostella]